MPPGNLALRLNKNIMKRCVLILSAIFFIFTAFAFAEPPKEIVEYYEQWIGCKSPKLRFVDCDRIQYLNRNPKGNKVLLYSFDSGDFVNAPDLEKLFSELSSLNKVRSDFSEDLIVIGFTYGVMYNPCLSDGSEIPEKIEKISRFPIINLNSRKDENSLGEPFELLKRPGAILIDVNGVICKMFLNSMSEDDFREAIKFPPWVGRLKQPPDKTSQDVCNEIANKK